MLCWRQPWGPPWELLLTVSASNAHPRGPEPLLHEPGSPLWQHDDDFGFILVVVKTLSVEVSPLLRQHEVVCT